MLLGLTILALLWPHVGFTQPSDEIKALKQAIEELQEGQARLQRELEAIKEALRENRTRQPLEPSNVVLNLKDDPFKGDKGARLTLIEFSDYQCPFCARHVRETLPQIEQDYIKTGKIKYVFRNFPIASLHPQAFKAHEVANCAGEQGKYWEMHDRLFSDQKAQAPQDLSRHAQALAIDMPTFQQCLESGKHAAKIREDIAEGQKAGISGTPTFFLGFTESNDSKVKALRSIRGAQPYSRFKQAIDSLLSSKAE